VSEQNDQFGPLTRRRFLNAAAIAAGGSALASVLPGSAPSARASVGRARPNSKFHGVPIGVITYSFRDLNIGVEGVLKACVESGCSSIELMGTGIEDWCGAPKAPTRGRGPLPAIGAPRAGGAPPSATPAAVPRRGAPTAEEQAALDKYNAELKAWRLAAPMGRFVQLRKMFNDAGVGIHIVKWEPAKWSNEEVDYAFKSAKAMGAIAVTDELSVEAARKLGPIAEKHGMIAAFHQHMQFATPGFETDVLKPALAVSRAVQMNFDIGHFAGSTGRHPNEIIDRYKDRIFSLHLKDKTGPKTKPPNENQVWGQGETPLEDVLLKVRDEKLPYYCDVELEYPVPPWSTAIKEVRTCVRYARQILTLM
jgi:sugar phosphate isomerase/epimerase